MMSSSLFDPGARRPRIAVLGSLVFDLAVRLERMPATHETVLARDVHISCGGKGLCQAVAAASLGAEVEAIGRIGADPFGDIILQTLDRNGIGHAHVTVDPAGTHIGIPMITPDGNNRIIGIPRASNRVTTNDVLNAKDIIQAADVLIVQCETPLPAISMAVTLAGQSATSVIWNPAPAVYPLQEVLAEPHGSFVSWLTPNEAEAAVLAGVPVSSRDDAIHAARLIRHAAAGKTGVIVTLGAQGSVAVDPAGHTHVTEPFAVDAIDSTGAGDAFTGTFATALGRGCTLKAAMQVAGAAGALATTRPGAADAMPSVSEVLHMLRTTGEWHA